MGTLYLDVPINRPVTPSKRRPEKVPVGGSNFGGHYQKKAFAAYVFPKEGATRLQMRDFEEARGANLGPHDRHLDHQVACHFHKAVEESAQPSKLRKEFDFAKANPPKKPGWEARCEELMKASASSPALGAAAAAEPKAEVTAAQQAPPATAPAQASQTAASGSMDVPQHAATAPPESATGLNRFMTMYSNKEVTADMLNPNFNPHPCLTRGFLKLSKGRARDWGVDLTTATGYKCPYYEAPQDRMALRREDPNTVPRVPEKSKIWTSEEAWSNPEHHTTFKVGQMGGTGFNPAPHDKLCGASSMPRARSALQLKADLDAAKRPEA